MSALPAATLPTRPRTAAPLPRRLPTPRYEPPAEHTAAGDTLGRDDGIQAALALDFVLPTGLPTLPAPRLRLVPPPSDGATGSTGGPGAARATGSTDEDDDDPRRRPTPRAELPEPRAWAGRLVQAVVEVVGGERPVGQLVRWTDADVYAMLQRRASRRPQAASGAQVARRSRSVIRSVRVSEPSDGVAEVSAVVARGGRCRALALRLDGLGGRWLCTALEIG